MEIATVDMDVLFVELKFIKMEMDLSEKCLSSDQACLTKHCLDFDMLTEVG